MSDMEFDKFVKPLENSLDSWRQGQQKKKETAAKRKKDADSKPGSETTRCLSYLKLQIFVTRTVYIFVTFNLCILAVVFVSCVERKDETGLGEVLGNFLVFYFPQIHPTRMLCKDYTLI
jgi:hypothetical protein